MKATEPIDRRPSSGATCRTGAKRGVDLLAAAVTLPAWAAYRLSAAALGAERAFPGYAQAFALLPGLCGVTLRRAFFRQTLRACGRDVHVGFGALLTSPETTLGARCYVGPYCVLGAVDVGEDALLGSAVSVTNGGRQHGIDRLDMPVREQPGEWPRVAIGRDAWVGDRAVVMADVGEQAVIAAAAVVTGPVGPRQIMAGVPARAIGERGAVRDNRPPTPATAASSVGGGD
ncbi:acyltransferase [Alienimonas californiensis]|uniref:Putative lipopolysaccharide biosynthesis O-acetyl transferase WbbJ n=1 Tax=Alienimonas californiensis TaxID=2527989 RepID=A0A517P4E0_9PLAN|nr:acyltransferase [Alienimonas californiensis]QDT14223.1 putative lipopolysaccharide biosynthesis O-acetyl transferase WbbJ [Alienimonas californiensis]